MVVKTFFIAPENNNLRIFFQEFSKFSTIKQKIVWKIERKGKFHENSENYSKFGKSMEIQKILETFSKNVFRFYEKAYE